MTWGDADQQQQCADDRRGAEDLHGVALGLDAGDRIEQRASEYEIHPVDVGHVDLRDRHRCRDVGQLGQLIGHRAGEHAVPHDGVAVGRRSGGRRRFIACAATVGAMIGVGACARRRLP
jgi:hypothetical protein